MEQITLEEFGVLQSKAFDILDEFHQNEELEETLALLKDAFPGSFVNESGEFIVERKSNTYFNLKDCKTPLDIECKVLEWCSRPASKGQPYHAEWRNKEFRKFMLDGINKFLETDFSEEEMLEIYIHLGNAIHHEKTIRFIESFYDVAVLKN